MEIKDRKKIVTKFSLYVKHDKLCVHLSQKTGLFSKNYFLSEPFIQHQQISQLRMLFSYAFI